MEQDKQQKMRCYATGRGFFVRLPISEDAEVDDSENKVEEAES